MDKPADPQSGGQLMDGIDPEQEHATVEPGGGMRHMRAPADDDRSAAERADPRGGGRGPACGDPTGRRHA